LTREIRGQGSWRLGWSAGQRGRGAATELITSKPFARTLISLLQDSMARGVARRIVELDSFKAYDVFKSIKRPAN
jgi:hypothetical protein